MAVIAFLGIIFLWIKRQNVHDPTVTGQAADHTGDQDENKNELDDAQAVEIISTWILLHPPSKWYLRSSIVGVRFRTGTIYLVEQFRYGISHLEEPLGSSYEEKYFFTAHKFLLTNIRYLKAVKQLDEIRMVLVLANIELGKLNYQDSIYSQHIQEIN